MKTKKIKKSSSRSQNNVFESSDFNTAVASTAVAQICQSVGYSGAQTSALNTLTAVAVRYLLSLGKSAATSACSTGRTQCNLLDVISGLEDVHSDIGFPGNSEPKRRLDLLSESSLLGSMMKFVYRTREIPFAKPVPRRCRSLPPNQPCFSDENVKWNHIPRWLPAFPKISEGGEKTVVAAASGDEMELWKKMRLTSTNIEISKLPKKRKKVSFKIGHGDRNESEIGFGGDLRSGFCRGGKRISWQMIDDEKLIDTSTGSDHDDSSNTNKSSKKKLEEACSIKKMILMS